MPAAERKAVVHPVEYHGMGGQRACKTIGSCRMTMRYKTVRTADVALRERMKAVVFGYRRLHVLLRREGHIVNHKKPFRLYREEKLTLRRLGDRKRANRGADVGAVAG